ncbi:MAG: O-antigen ligase family protein [Lachnospiraceae bacterium]|nr:O-antigen ligase family protein [Lachnospiraceae bacterium]
MIEKIKKITEEQVQKLLYYGLAVLMFVLPVPQLFLPESDKAVGMQATILAISVFYFGFLLLTECLNNRFSLEKGKLPVKCIIGMVLVGVISVISAEDKMLALYGSELRGEGFFSLLAYYLIFIGASLLHKEEYHKRILHLFILLGVLVVILGVIQYTGIYVFGGRFPGMAYVPMRNPNFYGGFTVLFTGVGIGGFYSYHKELEVTHPFSRWNQIIWYVLVIMGYIGCICARSALVYAGLVMMLLMVLFLALVSERRKLFQFFVLAFGLVAVIYLFDLEKGGGVTAEIKTVGEQIKTEGSVFGNSVGSGRMLIWKQIVSLMPEYGVLGCGVEHLGSLWIEKWGYSFNGQYVDKAHNEYLNLWITEGFFALVIYLVFLFSLFIPGLKQFFGRKRKTAEHEKQDMISKIAFFAFFGYIAQAFFNISVIQVAPYFWMICGLLYCGKRSVNEETVDS